MKLDGKVWIFTASTGAGIGGPTAQRNRVLAMIGRFSTL